MSHRYFKAAAILAGSLLLLCSTAWTQTPEKGAPRGLATTTSSEAARAAFRAALDEVYNFAGTRRVDNRLKAIVSADPNFALGRAYYGAYTSTFSQADRLRELDQALKDAVGATPAELLFVAALREWRAGRADVARDLLDVAHKQAPDDPNLLFVRMTITPDDRDAIRIGERAVTRFPDFAPPYNLLAYRLQNVGRHDDALKMVRKYVDLVPDHPNPYDSYAEILALQNKLAESDAQYLRVLEIDPSFDIAHDGLAENAARRGNFDGARRHLAASLELAPTPARKAAVERAMAVTYALEKKVTEARQQLAEAIRTANAAQLNAAVLSDRRTLALIAAIEGRAADALRVYAEAMPRNPDLFVPVWDAILHGLLGQAAEIQKAVNRMESNAATIPDDTDAKDAVHLTKVIHAVVTRDLPTARWHQREIQGTLPRAWAGAFLTKPLERAGDTDGAKASLNDVEALQNLSTNAALVRLIAWR